MVRLHKVGFFVIYIGGSTCQKSMENRPDLESMLIDCRKKKRDTGLKAIMILFDILITLVSMGHHSDITLLRMVSWFFYNTYYGCSISSRYDSISSMFL